MKLLYKQYALVRSSRAVMLSFIKDQIASDINTPVAAFNNKSIGYLLVHVADVYTHWLANFGMNISRAVVNDSKAGDMNAIIGLYNETDKLVSAFINGFESSIEVPISNYLNGELVTKAPVELFTHVITHEFHHKGQIMSMCRLLGHIPPDTDVIRL